MQPTIIRNSNGVGNFFTYADALVVPWQLWQASARRNSATRLPGLDALNSVSATSYPTEPQCCSVRPEMLEVIIRLTQLLA
ncbi:MAG: hypothetical protein AB3X44_17765 [Leptothrix sp. (in: b-proteobacteria)]